MQPGAAPGWYTHPHPHQPSSTPPQTRNPPGGIIPDLDAKTAKKNVTVADAGAAPLTEAKAAAIALNAALKTIPDAPPALARRMRAAAAHPTPSNLVAASAAPKTRRVVHCSNDGTCSAAYKQVIFLPPTPTTKPQELHVYVAADGGDVLLVADRLHTSRPGAALVAAAAAPPAPQKKDGGADKQKKDDPKKKAPERKPPGVHDDADAQQVWMSLGRGQSLYSGEVPLNTAQGPTAAGGGPYQVCGGVDGGGFVLWCVVGVGVLYWLGPAVVD